MKECPKCESIVTEDSTKYYNGLIKFGCDSTIHWDSSGKECFSQTEVCILRAELTKLKSDVERLRLAAKPIAESADWFFSGINDCNIICGKLTVGNLRALARALEETK